MRILLLLAAFVVALSADAQWTIQSSGTTASLRGVDSVGKGVAWASGTEGTVLRTEDGGATWQRCAVPPGAEALDFRGVQAFDAKTAIVMSSGKGDLSRLYKTTDGCQTWKLIITNPDKEGFWDSIALLRDSVKPTLSILVLGDPVGGRFTLFHLRLDLTNNFVPRLERLPGAACPVAKVELQLPRHAEGLCEDYVRYRSPLPKNGEASFAASNTSLLSNSDVWFRPIAFVTGGAAGARFLQFRQDLCAGAGCVSWVSVNLPMLRKQTAGAFSLAARTVQKNPDDWHGVIVGGDFANPDQKVGVAAYSEGEGSAWIASVTQPHGYRSAVAYDSSTKTWITVGPNGTDVSTDDGRNWRALRPGPGDAADADQHWNALSLPFVVGPKGRIGVLRADVLSKAASK